MPNDLINQEKVKRWEKPKLIVLGRGKPEESVLIFCKDAQGSDTSLIGCVS